MFTPADYAAENPSAPAGNHSTTFGLSTPETTPPPQPAQPDISKGLVLYYDFDNQIGDTLRDQSKQGNDGQATDIIWANDGHRGGAASFSSGDGYITVPDKPSLNPARFTMAVWIKTTAIDSWIRLFDKDAIKGYALTICGGGNAPPPGSVNIQSNGDWAYSSVRVDNGLWHHLVGTYDGSVLQVYVDGQASGSSTTLLNYQVSATHDLILGSPRSDPANDRKWSSAFKGLMDDVMLYNRALSADDVQSLFVSQGGTLTTSTTKPEATNSPAFGSTNAPPAPPPPLADHPVATVKLTEDQARAVVLIKGDNAEGTGFLIKTADGPMVVTNIHVISNNPHLVITTNTGATVTTLSLKGAADRDLAMFAIKDDHYSYLEVAPDVSTVAQPGDDVVTPGNSEGGEVMLNTGGKLLGIGPDRIEFDNPIYHGNSGGPVFHVKSGKVIGIVTQAMKVDVSDELDKASFANRNSAIGNSMRYFGFRLDNVHTWEPYDWQRLQIETTFLDQFDDRTKALDSYLNAPDDDKPEDNFWRKDDKLAKANSTYSDRIAGADTAQQLDAERDFYSDCTDLANQNFDAIQNLNNFYSFDRQRAKDEAAYRKALKKELDDISSNVERMSAMPRTNN